MRWNPRTAWPSGKEKTAKRMDAAGVKVIGYGAQAKDGDNIVGEFFSKPILKQSA